MQLLQNNIKELFNIIISFTGHITRCFIFKNNMFICPYFGVLKFNFSQTQIYKVIFLFVPYRLIRFF